MSTEPSKVGYDRLPSTGASTLSTTISSFESSSVDDDSRNSKIANRHAQPEDYTVSSLGSADDSCFSGGTASESLGRLSYYDLQRSPRQIKGPLSSLRVAPKAYVGRKYVPIAATCQVKPSPTPSSPAAVRVRAVATPVSPCIPVVHSAGCSTTSCASCRRKNGKLKKQAEEIEQLKSLVNHLVGLLGTSIQSKDTASVAEAAIGAGVDATPVVVKDETRTNQPERKSTEIVGHALKEPPESIVEVRCVSDEEADRTYLRIGGDYNIAPSTPPSPLCKAHSYSSPMSHDRYSPRSLQDAPSVMAPFSRSGTILRLCHLKNLKEESSSPSTALNKASCGGGTRHIHVCVRGEWGYYSGPTLEQNKKLHGCVVRFDSGDLYLGEMLLLVPKTTTFTDEHGLQFHGRGTLYRKDGPTTRGLFHKHELQE
jgi:hypothetical protein